MVTYKRLGLKMTRLQGGGWRVNDKNGANLFEGTGNKGTVMHDCLHQNPEKFVLKGNRWDFVQEQN